MFFFDIFNVMNSIYPLILAIESSYYDYLIVLACKCIVQLSVPSEHIYFDINNTSKGHTDGQINFTYTMLKLFLLIIKHCLPISIHKLLYFFTKRVVIFTSCIANFTC